MLCKYYLSISLATTDFRATGKHYCLPGFLTMHHDGIQQVNTCTSKVTCQFCKWLFLLFHARSNRHSYSLCGSFNSSWKYINRDNDEAGSRRCLNFAYGFHVCVKLLHRGDAGKHKWVVVCHYKRIIIYANIYILFLYPYMKTRSRKLIVILVITMSIILKF